MFKNWKAKAWKYATILIVAIIILNPEVAELALFIDAVGLEMFLMLIEVQVLVIMAMFYEKLKLLFSYLKQNIKRIIPSVSLQGFREEPVSILILLPSPVMLMHLLVFSYAIFLLSFV